LRKQTLGLIPSHVKGTVNRIANILSIEGVNWEENDMNKKWVDLEEGRVYIIVSTSIQKNLTPHIGFHYRKCWVLLSIDMILLHVLRN